MTRWEPRFKMAPFEFIDLMAMTAEPLALRCFFIAWRQADENGHARFARHELADLLGVKRSKGHERRHIDEAIRRQLLTPLSDPLCIVLPSEFEWGRPGRRSLACSHPHELRTPPVAGGGIGGTSRKAPPVAGGKTPRGGGWIPLDSAPLSGRPSRTLSTSPTRRLSPAVSVVTRGQLLLTAGRPPIACRAAWRAAA